MTVAVTSVRFAVVDVAVMLVSWLPVLASVVPPAAPSYTLWLTVYLAEQYTVTPGSSVATVPAPLLLQLKVPHVLPELSEMALARWLPVLLMLMLTVTSVPAAQQQQGLSLMGCKTRHALAAVRDTHLLTCQAHFSQANFSAAEAQPHAPVALETSRRYHCCSCHQQEAFTGCWQRASNVSTAALHTTASHSPPVVTCAGGSTTCTDSRGSGLRPALTLLVEAVTAPLPPTAVAVMTAADTSMEPASKSSCSNIGGVTRGHIRHRCDNKSGSTQQCT